MNRLYRFLAAVWTICIVVGLISIFYYQRETNKGSLLFAASECLPDSDYLIPSEPELNYDSHEQILNYSLQQALSCHERIYDGGYKVNGDSVILNYYVNPCSNDKCSSCRCVHDFEYTISGINEGMNITIEKHPADLLFFTGYRISQLWSKPVE